METLKSRIPEHLVQTVKSSSSVDDLLSSSSSLLRFLVGLPQFHQVKSSKTLTLLSASFSKVHWLVLKAVSELADPDLGCCGKSQESSLDLKRSGNLCFRSRSFDDALRFYSKALRVARDNTLLASLFLNRANALHVSYLSFSLRLVPFHSITQFILFFSCRIWGFLKRACGTAIVLFVLILVTPRFQLASFLFKRFQLSALLIHICFRLGLGEANSILFLETIKMRSGTSQFLCLSTHHLRGRSSCRTNFWLFQTFRISKHRRTHSVLLLRVRFFSHLSILFT